MFAASFAIPAAPDWTFRPGRCPAEPVLIQPLRVRRHRRTDRHACGGCYPLQIQIVPHLIPGIGRTKGHCTEQQLSRQHACQPSTAKGGFPERSETVSYYDATKMADWQIAQAVEKNMPTPS